MDPTGEQVGLPSPAGPRISVVVMTRDRRENVIATLRRLEALPERPPIILVDNASSDGTVAAVRREHPDVQVIAVAENLGAPARTLGVQAATTPFVAFADDDSWWEPGALARATEAFERSPELGLIAARILVGPARRIDPICRQLASSPLPTLSSAPGPSILGFVACAAVVRRAAYLQVGGFSPVIFFFGEETVLAQDLMAAGWQLAYLDDVVAVHDPQSAPTDRSGRARLGVRNALLSLWMRRPVWTAVARTMAIVGDRRDRAAVGGLLDALRRSGLALGARCVLPAHVESQVRLLERSADSLGPPR